MFAVLTNIYDVETYENKLNILATFYNEEDAKKFIKNFYNTSDYIIEEVPNPKSFNDIVNKYYYGVSFELGSNALDILEIAGLNNFKTYISTDKIHNNYKRTKARRKINGYYYSFRIPISFEEFCILNDPNNSDYDATIKHITNMCKTYARLVMNSKEKET